MENDSIRSSGSDTLIDLWIDGQLRGICISEEAIGAFVGFAQATIMSDKDRCEFVKSNLPLVLAAAKARLPDAPDASSIKLEAGHLPTADGGGTDRRKEDRRKDERRSSERKADPARPDRRRSDRRAGERRRSPRSR